jgi:hypothetical protein
LPLPIRQPPPSRPISRIVRTSARFSDFRLENQFSSCDLAKLDILID